MDFERGKIPFIKGIVSSTEVRFACPSLFGADSYDRVGKIREEIRGKEFFGQR